MSTKTENTTFAPPAINTMHHVATKTERKLMRKLRRLDQRKSAMSVIPTSLLPHRNNEEN